MNEKNKQNGNGNAGADEALWRAAMKDVRPLKKVAPEPPHSGAKDNRKRIRLSMLREDAAVPSGETTGRRGREVDRKTTEKLRGGRMIIEARLDLHGLGQDAAHQALKKFILHAYGQRQRCVLVITGKGTSAAKERKPEHWTDRKSGILREKVPEWLNLPPLADIVLQALPAQRRHGGDGALYVHLRRRRDFKER